ncbi:MAG TPA: cupin domain-containing protein [Candidatus Limnocylindrales bacterium]|nr:cupin domain-containing protein [Candidatus Limnocylindrales bacterium]
MEIRRFGIGQRRPDGPPGTHNVQGALIDSGPHGVVAELALARHASIELHTNPNTAWFVVIEGGGLVTVGSERSRVFAGEAVLWPAGVPHGASTELTEMRAIVVEFPPMELALGPGAAIVDVPVVGAGSAAGSVAGSRSVEPADGRLVDERPAPYDPRHGEPR